MVAPKAQSRHIPGGMKRESGANPEQYPLL